MALPNYIICIDSREQKPWMFDPEEKKSGKTRILGSEIIALDAADYAIKGAEDLVRIERKAGFCELFGNMTPKDHKIRFENEMEKLRKVKHKYIVIEDSVSNDILGLSIPQSFKSPPLSVVYRWLFELQMEYGIVPIFAGNAGKRTARNIFEVVARKYL